MSSLTTLIFFRALLARKLARQLQPREPRRIPAFSDDGSRRLRSYSQEACLHLEAGGWARLKRSRRGTILAVIFGDNVGTRTLQPGQRYSYLEPVLEGKVWQHVEHRTGRDEFQQTVLDVTTPKEQTTA